MKIGVLIPATSNGREWNNYKKTYLYINTLKSFLLTYDKEHSYTFYIGIDRNDKVYDDKLNQEEFTRFCSIMTNIKIEFMYMDDISKGHLTIMWIVLFNKAYNDGCDYFFQCGDDINFKTTGWVNSCINALKQSNNITSFIARSDFQAIGALKAINESGLKVPYDISLVGYADSDLCDYISPKLSSIHYPFEKIAKLAIDLLLMRIKKKYYEKIKIISVAQNLIIRESIAKVNMNRL